MVVIAGVIDDNAPATGAAQGSRAGAPSTRLSALFTTEASMTSLRVLAMAAMAMLMGLTSSGPAWAGAPTDQLRGRIDRVIGVLEDPALKQDARVADRRAAIRAIANEIFDFRELSQRTLARHWQGRTAAERDEFVQLFADLLERSYIGKIETYTGGERVQYTGEAVDGDQATVRTKIVPKAGTEIPIDYRMHRAGDGWLVYDVSIEGVSLVANYRSQFNRIIQQSSFKELIAKLAAKKEEALAADGNPVNRAHR
jgi:phospholipid transport system substrate-binding protein